MKTLWIKFKTFLAKVYVWSYRLAIRIKTGNHKAVKRKILLLYAGKEQAKSADLPLKLSEKIFLAMTCRINSRQREDILEVVVPSTLQDLSSTGLNIKVIDASEEIYAQKNREVLNRLPNLKVNYSNEKLSQPASIEKILATSPQPFFSLFYDDQVIVGLNEGMLSASISLLEDFKGWVDLVLIELMMKFDVDNGLVVGRRQDLQFRTRKIKPLGVVKYGNYEFAIMENRHYGFFFNTVIARREDYLRKLQWYRKHCSEHNSNLIELAGAIRRGPVYNYLAVPLQSYMLNVDFAHTEHSIRDVSGEEVEIFKALKNGYKPVMQ